MRPSIFVVSLPRSLSSQVYHILQQMTALETPTWTTDGEILNNDRHILFRGDRYESGLKYLRRRHAPDIFHQITGFLNDCTHEQGFIYKDVVNPFVVANWPKLDHYFTVAIDRPIADVAYSVLKKKWRYPGYAVQRIEPSQSDIIEGLIRARQALGQLTCHRLCFDQLITDELSLARLLGPYEEFAPVRPIRYLSTEFCYQRDQILARRTLPEYVEIQDQIRQISNQCGISYE